MKKVITATLIALSAAAAQAEPFDFERQFGTAALFPSVATDGYTAPNGSAKSSPVFMHERDFGHVELYPTLVSEQIETNIHVGARSLEPYNYWAQVWNTDVEIGG